MLPTRARIIKDLTSSRYNIHFARVEPGSGAAINQGRFNGIRGQLEFTTPAHVNTEPVLRLTRPECDTLYEALGKTLNKTADQVSKDELAAVKKDLLAAQQERDDARGRNVVLVNEAGRQKNELRDTQARLAQMTEMYSVLLDRLSK
jgi:ribosomal protein S20